MVGVLDLRLDADLTAVVVVVAGRHVPAHHLFKLQTRAGASRGQGDESRKVPCDMTTTHDYYGPKPRKP